MTQGWEQGVDLGNVLNNGTGNCPKTVACKAIGTICCDENSSSKQVLADQSGENPVLLTSNIVNFLTKSSDQRERAK